ncbi:MAG: (2Fe-2S)-binding protein [Elusimicrobiota bacterium]
MKKIVEKFKLDCIVNGKRIVREVEPHLRLIDFLRNDLGLKGTKEGCGEGECGSCMVLLNNKAVNSCLIMAFQVAGKEITTIEGIDKLKYAKELKESFKKNGAVQCGFCTPGFMITAIAMLMENPQLSIEEIKKGLSGNICRCTGYDKIIKAVDEARR